MNEQEKELTEKYRQLNEVIEHYGQQPGQLIRILQQAQEIFGYLPEEVQTYIAGRLDMPVSEVNGVVTFYSLFHTEPQGKYKINVCLGTACYVQGSRDILAEFRHQLGLNESDTSADGLFTVKSTRCLGACGLSPVLTVNQEVHGEFKRQDVGKLLRACRRRTEVKRDDQPVERPAADQAGAPPGP
ncbi:complex I 24 kDa subunit family protein [Desulfotomaculum copahuensis]|uniref:NADH:ubiquinone oxidoreductase n=1 Tax=Desulfotomaculum copahuensis TaxID=1838280 RepID=A0A1B7LH51_9FIRM|nr:NAD(P)H-dependent oxidoreductase subunit E [Desulfotomaculum copahuensis]OAT85512.1 NADH:ubiquinone oxidoreductase [Desulfotomaculum copahuensis]